jgi:hypothetical protein
MTETDTISDTQSTGSNRHSNRGRTCLTREKSRSGLRESIVARSNRGAHRVHTVEPQTTRCARRDMHNTRAHQGTHERHSERRRKLGVADVVAPAPQWRDGPPWDPASYPVRRSQRRRSQQGKESTCTATQTCRSRPHTASTWGIKTNE